MLNKHNLKLKSAHYGFFPQKDLETSNRYGSHYIGHPTRQVNGVGQNTGTLGHRLAGKAAGSFRERHFQLVGHRLAAVASYD